MPSTGDLAFAWRGSPQVRSTGADSGRFKVHAPAMPLSSLRRAGDGVALGDDHWVKSKVPCLRHMVRQRLRGGGEMMCSHMALKMMGPAPAGFLESYDFFDPLS